jgi:hypothetical protein
MGRSCIESLVGEESRGLDTMRAVKSAGLLTYELLPLCWSTALAVHITSKVKRTGRLTYNTRRCVMVSEVEPCGEPRSNQHRVEDESICPTTPYRQPQSPEADFHVSCVTGHMEGGHPLSGGTETHLKEVGHQSNAVDHRSNVNAVRCCPQSIFFLYWFHG